MVNPKYKLIFFFVAIYICACWCLEGDFDNDAELTPNPTASNTPKPTPTFTLDLSRVLHICEDYENKEMSIVIHNILQGASSFTMYIKIPGGVYPLIGGDKEEYEFSAQMGGLKSLECKVFESEKYRDRLYCFFPFTPDHKNTAQPFFLFMANCPEPIFSHPAVSLMVEGIIKPPKAESESPCGPEPSTCGIDHENWCLCDGGLGSGCVEGAPVCFYP